MLVTGSVRTRVGRHRPSPAARRSGCGSGSASPAPPTGAIEGRRRFCPKRPIPSVRCDLQHSLWARPSIRFEVTEIGSKYLRNKPDKFLEGSELCYSHKHVLSIISIERIGKSETQPELLRVSYHFERQGNGSWSFLPGVQNIVLPNAPAMRTIDKTATIVLIHKGSGWEPKD